MDALDKQPETVTDPTKPARGQKRWRSRLTATGVACILAAFGFTLTGAAAAYTWLEPSQPRAAPRTPVALSGTGILLLAASIVAAWKDIETANRERDRLQQALARAHHESTRWQERWQAQRELMAEKETALMQQYEALNQEVESLNRALASWFAPVTRVGDEGAQNPSVLALTTLQRIAETLAQSGRALQDSLEQALGQSSQLQDLATITAQAGEEQLDLATSVNTMTEQVITLLREAAAQTAQSDQSLERAIAAAVDGQAQVQAIHTGAATLQEEAERIVKRTQNLNDFVQLAAQFTQEQKRIAAMTRVLSLNASMLAARATKQQDPEQFASVAKEFETVAKQVNELAVQTNQGLIVLQQRTDRIQTVVSGLGYDIDSLSQTVDRFTNEVEQAQIALDTLASATEAATQCGQAVSQSHQAALGQVGEALQLTRTLTEMATTVQQRLASISHQAERSQQQAHRMQSIASPIYALTRRVEHQGDAFELPSVELDAADERGSEATLVDASRT